MLATRQLLISALLFAAVPPAAVQALPTASNMSAERSIDSGEFHGTFNFEDAKEFRFTYNGSVFKLPYDQITSTNIEKSRLPACLARLPGMSPVASHRKQTLVINYTDATGAAGTLNFELMAYRAVDAQETIAAKRSPISAAAATAATNVWWGDEYLEDQTQSAHSGTQRLRRTRVAQPPRRPQRLPQPGQAGSRRN